MDRLSNPSPDTPIDRRRIWRAAVATSVIALVVNLLIFLLAEQLLSINVQVPEEGQLIDLEIIPILTATLIPAVGATALLMLLAHFTKRPLGIFWGISALVMALSFIPLVALDIPAGSAGVLSFMHLMTGAILVWGLSSASHN